MSYEGYTIYLCKGGHRMDFNCWADSVDWEGTERTQCQCGQPFVARYDVDETNGDAVEPDLEVDTPAQICTCPTCNNRHIVRETTFRIPQNMKHLWR